MTPPSSQSPEHILAALVCGQLSPHGIPLQVSADETSSAWEKLIPLARRHGLAPMLSWIVREAGVDTSAHPVWQPLLASARRASAWYLLAAATRDQIEQTLGRAGIPTIWLKGMALAPTVYPQPTLRPMLDMDVLVPHEQRERALDVVGTLGYRPASPPLFSGAQELIHNYTLRNDTRTPVTVELHYRLLDTSDRLLSLAQLDWFWRHTQTCSDKSASFAILQPEAHLLYLCAHTLLQHSAAEFRLQWYLDLDLLITRSPALNWQVVITQAAALGWTYAVEQALTTAREYFSTPAPDEVLLALRTRRPEHEDVAFVTRGQKEAGRWQRAVRRYARLSWPARLRLIFGGVVPAAAYMRWRYRVDSDWKLPFYYVYRWLDMAGEILRSVGRRRRKPEG